MLKNFAMSSVLVTSLALATHAAELSEQFPSVIHANERYVIYSHGLIVEGTDPRPVSPKYGLYDFPAIKQALFDVGGFNLIAMQRPKNVEFDVHVAQLEAQVERLLAAGVKPSHITLVGFSRGGQLTAVASTRRSSRSARTVIFPWTLR